MKKTAFFLMLIIYVCGLSFSAAAAKSETTQAATSSVQKQNVGQVTNLKFEKSDLTTVTFSWQKVKDAQRYYLYHYTDGADKPEYIGDTTNTQATVNGLESGKTYKFAVRAVKQSEGKKLKGKLSSPLLTVTAPEGKVTPKTKTISDTSVSLYWDSLDGATGYKVYYYDRNAEKYVAYNHTKGTSMTVEGLEKNTFYSFKIRAYRWVGSALSYGEYGDVYLEATDTHSVPRTYSQSAKEYNSQINSLKKKQNMTVHYKKTIDTEFLLCDTENLANTVKNTINLYDGTLNKKYVFNGGKYGSKTPDSIFEPYGKAAGVERNDIENFSINVKDDGYTIKLILRSEENFFDGDNDTAYLSNYNNILSLPKYKTLDTTPLKIKKADSYYSEGVLIYRVKNNSLSSLKIRCGVMSSIDFSVATLDANTVIAYKLSEDYVVRFE